MSTLISPYSSSSSAAASDVVNPCGIPERMSGGIGGPRSSAIGSVTCGCWISVGPLASASCTFSMVAVVSNGFMKCPSAPHCRPRESS